jgi:succinate dehydrogenase / fumarate reductase iron-sulfur subunit
MRVKLKIKRFNPEQDSQPQWREYAVEVEPTDRVLDALHAVKWHHDGSLAFRRSCAHGICGSDAMMINGRNRLACKVLIRELSQPIVIEPMRGFAVVKDLVVEMTGFFEKYKAIKPYLIAQAPPPEQERRQSPKERERFDDTTKCILCGACTTSCPSFWANHEYLGPAAIVQAHRFLFDSRDQGGQERLAVLNQRSGVWRCRTIFNCTDACPRGINVTKAIGQVKKLLVKRRVALPP